MSFATLALLFAVAVTLHNAEEAVWLPAWSGREGTRAATVSAREFRFSVAVLTLVAWVVAVVAGQGGRGGVFAYLVCGYALAMLINAVIPHLAVTVAFRRYAPGTATALAVNVPIAVALIHRALVDGWVTWQTYAWAGPLSVVALLASVPALLSLGRRILPREC